MWLSTLVQSKPIVCRYIIFFHLFYYMVNYDLYLNTNICLQHKINKQLIMQSIVFTRILTEKLYYTPHQQWKSFIRIKQTLLFICSFHRVFYVMLFDMRVICLTSIPYACCNNNYFAKKFNVCSVSIKLRLEVRLGYKFRCLYHCVHFIKFQL